MKTLFPFQINALKSLAFRDKALLALDMGLGKTFTGLKWLQQKNRERTYTIILCQKNKLDDWENEIKEVFGLETQVLKVKSQQHLKDELGSVMEGSFIVLSYSLFTLFSKVNLRWWDRIKNITPNLLFDESQGLRNRTSLISKYTYLLSVVCKYVLLLSGDPTPNGYQDLYQQLRVLNVWSEGYSWYDFLREFCHTRVLPGTSVLMIIGYKNEERLLALMNNCSYFLKTEDAIGLPEKQNLFHQDLTPIPHYHELRLNKMVSIKVENDLYETVSEGPLTELLYLRELSSGFIKSRNVRTNEQTYLKIHNHKINLIKEILEQSSDQVVIFYNFKEERKQLISLLSENHWSYIQIDGESNELNQLKNQRVILVQYQSGSKGVDGLQFKSNRVIYYSPTLSGELFKQSIKRIHRIGQTKSCIYHFIINSKLEQLIFQKLRNFEDFTLNLFSKLKNEI